TPCLHRLEHVQVRQLRQLEPRTVHEVRSGEALCARILRAIADAHVIDREVRRDLGIEAQAMGADSSDLWANGDRDRAAGRHHRIVNEERSHGCASWVSRAFRLRLAFAFATSFTRSIISMTFSNSPTKGASVSRATSPSTISAPPPSSQSSRHCRTLAEL